MSCNQRADNREQIDRQDLTDTVLTSETIPTDFGGNWVNKKYVDKLKETKSPKASQDIVPITMLMLPKETNQKATIIWGFHEGTSGTVKQHNGQFGIQTGTENEFELTFKLEDNLLKTEKDEFVKIKYSDDGHTYDIIEQLLFAGKYDLEGKQVEFTYDGKVKGLDTIAEYTVIIDYYDAGMQVDQLYLGAGYDNHKRYGFQFKQDTLIIYQLDCVQREDDYCVVVANGQELFKMTKK